MENSEIQHLMQLLKYKKDNTEYLFPFSSGERIYIPLLSDDPKEVFDIIIRSGSIELQKYHIINRARRTINLFRIDLDEHAIHLNPNGQKIIGPHLHIYTQEYGDKMAVNLPGELQRAKMKDILHFFMQKCNIVQPPNIKVEELFV